MDDISRKANVSKRTLYDFFKDKEDLLIEALYNIRKPVANYFEMSEKSSETALDVILGFRSLMLERSTGLCENFWEDIKRYPGAIQVLKDGQYKFLDEFIDLLKRGEKEEIFVSDINYEIVSMLAHNELRMAKRPSDMLSKFSIREVHNTVFYIFIRGICTDAGRKIFDKYVMKVKYQKDFSVGI
jgi:AcrR family transcriptional regulator